MNKIHNFKHAKVYGKLEWYNPFGSIKDRIAYNMVQYGKQVELLGTKDKQLNIANLVEASSGNTGLGLALVAK